MASAPATGPTPESSGRDLPLFSALGGAVIFAWQNFVASILGVLSFMGDLIIVLGKTIGFIFKGKISIRLTIAQMSFLGVDSLGIVLICLAFTGMTVAKVLMQQVDEYGFGKEFVGGAMLWAMCKELGPVLTGLILAGRAGAGMASEIGTMKVTEQIDALRATGVHPVQYLAVPRVLASVIMGPMITFCACVIGVVAGYLSAHFFSETRLSFNTYFDSVQDLYKWELMRTMLRKSLMFGLLVAGVAVSEGFNTEGGAEGVGRAVTRAVVNAMILIFFANMIMTLTLRV